MSKMRIGFATIYSWRPHVEHLHFLAQLARSDGHETFFLTCDGDLPDCYTRELRDQPAWLECLKCRAGGIRSYASEGVDTIGALGRAAVGQPPADPAWAQSSASTLGRFESDADYASEAFRLATERMRPVVELSFAAARAWIQRQRLDAVCVFNGRIDATRAIFEAAKSLGVRVVTLERTWFGDGLQLYPEENCLGLRSVDTLVREWRDRPLTRGQALRASAQIARRFLRSNTKEWRAYNTNARETDWPVAGAGRRILLIPSSRNEVWGQPDWEPPWSEPTAAYDALMDHFGLGPHDVLLRCHPNWGESIGKQDGHFSTLYYQGWAQRRGVTAIPSTDTASTISLIQQCDAIVVAHGSAALEAGMLGKQVIGTAPTFYQEAGLRDAARTPTELAGLRLQVDLPEAERRERSIRTMRQTLRFCHTMVYRVAQYTGHVKAETTTRYRYDLDANPHRFIDLLRTGVLQADDATSAPDAGEEDEVLARIEARDWRGLVDALEPDAGAYVPVRRRPLFRPIDTVRRWMPLGDR
jgi:hypothetical protein